MNYSYDALGRRTSRSTNGQTTTFQYDMADVVIDRVSDGSSYDYLNGLSVDDKLRQSGGSWGTMYFLADQFGSTSGLAGINGTLVEPVQQYEAFGASAGSARTRYGYAGRERDDLTGTMYYRSRWYDQQQGRYLTESQRLFLAGPPITYSGGKGLDSLPGPNTGSSSNGAANPYSSPRNNPTQPSNPSGQNDSPNGTSEKRRNGRDNPPSYRRPSQTLNDRSGYPRGFGPDTISDLRPEVPQPSKVDCSCPLTPREPDFISFQYSFPVFPWSSHMGYYQQWSVDSYGNIYRSTGFAAGYPGVSGVSLTMGWLLRNCRPSEKQMNDFLTGLGFGAGGFYGGYGGGLGWSPGNE